MVIRGAAELVLGLGNSSWSHTFLILEELDTNILIGNDMIAKSLLVIDFMENAIRMVDGLLIPFKVKKEESNERIGVNLLNNLKMAPKSVRLVRVKVGGDPFTLLEVNTPLDIFKKHNVYIRTGIVEAGRKSIVELYNPNNFPVILVSGSSIGNAKRFESLNTIMVSSETEQTKEGEEIDRSKVTEKIKQMNLDEDTDLDDTQKDQLKNLLINNWQRFAVNPKAPGRNFKVKHHIDTGNNEPIKSRYRRFSPGEQDVANKEIKEMLENNVIQKSKSPWASPIVLVRKADGQIRFCVDYRKLNKITKKDNYPMPRIDDTLDKFKNKRYFSTMDLASGFWQVEMAEEDKEKTAFISHKGLFEFNVMPFGLCNATATFQRMMDEVVEDIDWEVGSDYVDDLMNATSTFEEHLVTLQKIFDRLNKFGLTMKLEKCKFCKTKLVFLGHEVSMDGIRPNPKKVSAIEKILPPIDLTGLRRFLGLTTFYRKFIPEYSKKAEPLNNLLRKANVYKWDGKCQEAFALLKKCLMEAPVLKYPDYSKPFTIHTDASKIGLGAILCQTDEMNKEHVIAYASRTINKHERNYSITELECLAVVWAIQYFKVYIYGRKFLVYTDHKALKWLLDLPEPSGRLARWVIKLQEHDMEIKYRVGKENSDADALSRMDESGRIHLLTLSEDREIVKLQRMDEYLAPIRNYLSDGRLPEEEKEARRIITEASGFELVNDILYRSIPTGRMKRNKEVKLRLAIPKAYIKQILHQNHNNVLAGHLGIKKTYERIRNEYYWIGMMQDVKEWIAMCVDCAMKKGLPDKNIGHMGTIEASEPLEIIGADILGPLPRTVNGNRYILVMTDHFTKYVEIAPLKTQKAEEVAESYIKNIGCRIGFPKKFLSDRGKNFIGEVMKEIHKRLDIQQMSTASAHPQTNALVERFNKTVVMILSMYVSAHQKDWDELVSYAAYAYNTSIHPSTNETPFFLMYGRDPNILDQLVREEYIEKSKSIEEYKSDLLSKMAITYNEVKYFNNLAAQKRIRRAEKTQIDSTFKVGDLVWLYNPVVKQGQSRKLAHPWKGPFRIEDTPSEWNVILRNLSNKTLRQPVHVSRLKLYKTPARPTEELGPIQDDQIIDEEAFESEEPLTRPMEVEDQGGSLIESDLIEEENWNGQEFEVERIVDDRMGEHGREYLVRWKGYPPSGDTWTPQEDLNCEEILSEYKRKIGGIRVETRDEVTCGYCGKYCKSRNGLKNHVRECKKKQR